MRGPSGPRRKCISEVKPDAMMKFQIAHELAWFLCDILWVANGTRLANVYANRDLDSMLHCISSCPKTL